MSDYTDLLDRLKRMAIPAHGDEEDTLLEAIRAIECLLKRPAASGADYMELEARLRKQTLPICPFDRRSPNYGKDMPICPVCGGEADGPDKCRGADTRIMDEAANALADLRKQRDDRDEARDLIEPARQLRARVTSLEAQLAEAQRLLELSAGELYTIQNQRDRIEADLAYARAEAKKIGHQLDQT